MIPFNKLSKRQQKELNAQKRVTWGFSPVSRVKSDSKKYNRKKQKEADKREVSNRL